MKRAVIIFLLSVSLMIPFSTVVQAENAYHIVVQPNKEYSYEDMLNDAKALQQMHPDLIRYYSIGKSVEGRELLLIEFGNGPRKVFVNGAIHASEYISTSYLMYMIDQYAYAYKTSGTYNGFNLMEILSGVTFCILPMVNPDGVNLVQNGTGSVLDQNAVSKIAKGDPGFVDYSCWKANINGVDLNRNFDNNWYVKRPITAPATKLFKGYSPLSEPETRAVSSFVKTNMCWAFVNFHSQGGGIYGWDDKNAAYYPQLNSMVSEIMKSSGFKKLADTQETNYGTFAGYVRETFIKPTITIELCRYISDYPYPNEDFSSVWKSAQSICLIVADEVLNMQPQEYLVFQNGAFLQGFCNSQFAAAFAAKYEGATVKYIKGGFEALTACQPTNSAVTVDGNTISIEAYNIKGNNYFKLRDLAMAINGTGKQFSVDYDSQANAISITPGSAYLSVGGELSGKIGASALAMKTQSQIFVNSQNISVTVYNINDNNYFKLRDIGKALNFGVTWDANTNKISIDTTAAYSE